MERIRIKDIAKLADVSVGTVDRVIHGRSGVSEASRKRVEEILKQLDYQPNMYASALASNKKYAFACLLPQHEKGEYWTDVETGIYNAVETYSDFNVAVQISYYDPYDYHSFAEASGRILEQKPDGVMFAPTIPQYTKPFTEDLNLQGIPYIYIDSNIKEEPALSFFGQDSHQSGYFAARMLMLLAGEDAGEVVIFRKINEGIVGSNQQ
ncbi:substrate-binding domain-containing protein, partial [Bacteroides heparinolyticus]